MSILRQSLASSSDQLVSATNLGEINNLAREIALLLNQASGNMTPNYDSIKLGSGIAEGVIKSTFIPNAGRAINPYSAAECVMQEPYRTHQYIKGVRRAIESKLREKKEPVKVLYAGTGPFAPLVITSLHSYRPDQVQIYYLDIHKFSINSVSHIIRTLGYNDFTARLMVDDATSCRLDFTPDILVTETMNASLLDEPQYWICKNLFPQIAEDGIVVPEQVTVTVALANRYSRYVGRIVNLGEVTSVRLGGDLSVKKVFTTPPGTPPLNSAVILQTNIVVSGGIALAPNQTRITRDFKLDGEFKGERLKLTYHPGSEGAAFEAF